MDRLFAGRRYLALLFLGVLSLLICACQTESDSNFNPQHLRIGLLPDQNKEQQQAIYQSLFDHISTQIGVTYELVFASSYNHLLTKFQDKQVDLAYFGGYTFLKANENSGAVPLVMRDIDRNFVSYLITKKDNKINDIKQLNDHSFAFGAKMSTSGHLMPRYFFKKLNINPELFFSSVEYTGSHDRTAQWVKQGKVEAGVLNSQIFDQLRAHKTAYQNELDVIWQSPPYPNYVWAIQANTTEDFNISLINAFLSITGETIEGQKILSQLSINSFFPAQISDFDELKQATSDVNQ